MQSMKFELHSIKEDNLKDMQAQHKLNVVLSQNLTKIKQNPTHTSSNVVGGDYKNEGDKEEERSISYTSHKLGKRGSYSTSTTTSSSPPRYRKKSKHSHSSKLKGELKKNNAPFFEGDID